MAFRVPNIIDHPLKNLLNRHFSIKSYIEANSSAMKGLIPTRDDVPTGNESTSAGSYVAFPGLTLIGGKYHVCRPRTMPLTIRREVHNEMDVARKAVALQQLQPSMMAAYYTEPFASEISKRRFALLTEEQIKASTKKLNTREVENSGERRKVSTTVKPPKPTNPFPDPVTVLPTHALLQPLWPLPRIHSRVFSTIHYRRPSPVPCNHFELKKSANKLYRPFKKKVITFMPEKSREALGILAYSEFRSPEQLYAAATQDFNEDLTMNTAKRGKICPPYPSYSEAWKAKVLGTVGNVPTYGIEMGHLGPFIHRFHTSSISLAEKKDEGKGKRGWTSGRTKKPCQYKPPVEDYDLQKEKSIKKQQKGKKPTGKKKASDRFSSLPMTLPRSYEDERIQWIAKEIQNMIRGSVVASPKETMEGWLRLHNSKPGSSSIDARMKRMP